MGDTITDANYDSGDGDSTYMMLRVSSDSRLTLAMRYDTGSQQYASFYARSALNKIVPGQWHDVLVTYDPVAKGNAEKVFGRRIDYGENEYDILDGADALVIVTEWLQYRRPDWDTVRTALRNPTVFDGRNLFDPERMRALGFSYYSIGRRDVD